MKIIWNQALGLKEAPYMHRWVIDFKYFAIRLHSWHDSDDLEYPHDHDWWFLSLVLYGSYINVIDGHGILRSAGSLEYFPATFKHCVAVPKKAITLLITGPKIRDFGFWVEGKFIKAKRYFFQIGHHTPDQNGRVKTDMRV